VSFVLVWPDASIQPIMEKELRQGKLKMFRELDNNIACNPVGTLQ
jgi:hypothetical protein